MGLGQIEVADLGELKLPHIGLSGHSVFLESRTVLLLKSIQLPGKLHHDGVPRAFGESCPDRASPRAFPVGRCQGKNSIRIGREFDLSFGWEKARQLADHRVILGSLSLLDPDERLDTEHPHGLCRLCGLE